jgi:hypothetical protein
MNIVTESFTPYQISASALIKNVSCQLGGIFVSAASGTPTITIYDVATAATTGKIVDTFTPLAGTFYPLPFSCGTGLYVVISGTVSCTVGVSGA